MRALNLLRLSLHYRRETFSEGLRSAGFRVQDRIDKPEPGDLLLIWNRYAGFGDHADRFERYGARVLVAENCPLGNSFLGGSYSIAGRHVALTGGEIIEGGPERWDSWGVELLPFRAGGETVILGQRGIGHQDIASPARWAENVQRRIGGRIRQHPGQGHSIPLAEDLKDAGAVVTWSSAAAIQAMMLGVPVWHEHPGFVGSAAADPLSKWGQEPRRDESARLAVFRRLAWGIWTLPEIRSGAPFVRSVT